MVERRLQWAGMPEAMAPHLVQHVNRLNLCYRVNNPQCRMQNYIAHQIFLS
jgi:hypothetical protein